MLVFPCPRLFVGVLIGFITACDHSPGRTSTSSVSGATPPAQAPAKRRVYNESADAHADIDKVVAEARADRKRILLVFGANWCHECLILDAHLHEPPAKAVVEASFHVVDVDIGGGGDFLDGSPPKNRDLVKQYAIPLNLGVPAVAVLDRSGSLLYAQQDGAWTPVAGPSATAVVAFLNRWKPPGR